MAEFYISFPFSFKPSSWEAVANEEMWQARWCSFAPFQQPVGDANSLAWKYTPKWAAWWCMALLDLNVPSFGRKRLAEWDEACMASGKSFRKVVVLFTEMFCSKYLEGAEGSWDIGWENTAWREICITDDLNGDAGVLSHKTEELYGHTEDVYNHVMWAGYVQQLLYGSFSCFSRMKTAFFIFDLAETASVTAEVKSQLYTFAYTVSHIFWLWMIPAVSILF